MKKIFIPVIVLMLLLAFAVGVSAEDIYKEQYDASGAGSLFDLLPEENRELLEGFGEGGEGEDWIKTVRAENIFLQIFEFIKGEWKAPMRAVAVCSAVLLVAAAVRSVAPDELDTTLSFICLAGICGAVIVPACSLIASLSSALSSASVFMSGFVPIYIGILTVSGQTALAASSGGMLLGAAEAVSFIASFFVTPIISACLALGLASAFSPLGAGKETATIMKKTATWVLGASAAIFSGVISVQTTISAAADKLTFKTAKLFTSSVIPVVGGAVGESLTTVATCFSVLKTSVAAIGILSLAAVFIPIIIEILLWRLCLFLVSMLASFLGLKEVSGAVSAVDGGLSLMVSVSVLIALAFIISLTVVTIFGGNL